MREQDVQAVRRVGAARDGAHCRHLHQVQPLVAMGWGNMDEERRSLSIKVFSECGCADAEANGGGVEQQLEHSDNGFGQFDEVYYFSKNNRLVIDAREAKVSRILLETSMDHLAEDDRREGGTSTDAVMIGEDCFWLGSTEGRCLNRDKGAPRRRVRYKWGGGSSDDCVLVQVVCFEDSAANVNEATGRPNPL